jgi:hypothetical protein
MDEGLRAGGVYGFFGRVGSIAAYPQPTNQLQPRSIKINNNIGIGTPSNQSIAYPTFPERSISFPMFALILRNYCACTNSAALRIAVTRGGQPACRETKIANCVPRFACLAR